jgi:hypothetical protein
VNRNKQPIPLYVGDLVHVAREALYDGQESDNLAEITEVLNDGLQFTLKTFVYGRTLTPIPRAALVKAEPPNTLFIALTNFGMTQEQIFPIYVQPKQIRAMKPSPNGGSYIVVESGPAGTFHVQETPERILTLIARFDGWPMRNIG